MGGIVFVPMKPRNTCEKNKLGVLSLLVVLFPFVGLSLGESSPLRVQPCMRLCLARLILWGSNIFSNFLGYIITDEFKAQSGDFYDLLFTQWEI